MTFTNVPAAPGTRAGLSTPRNEAEPSSAQPTHADETPEASTLVSGVEACRRCGGSGVIAVRGESLNPFSGVESWDPELDDDYTCPACDGMG